MSSEDVPGSPARRASAPSSLRRALPGAAAGVALPRMEVNHVDIAVLVDGNTTRALGLQLVNVRQPHL